MIRNNLRQIIRVNNNKIIELQYIYIFLKGRLLICINSENYINDGYGLVNLFR